MDKLSKYVDFLKEKNIRMTSQRYAILKYLIQDEKHPNVNEIYEDLKDEFPIMSVATIYNNLNFFKETGIVKELPFGDGSSRFDLTTVEHYHAICTECGKIEDFYYPRLTEDKELVESLMGFEVHEHRFEVSGICKECQQANKKSSG